MARKGSQQKNGVSRHALNQKGKGSDSRGVLLGTKGRAKAAQAKVFPGEEILDGNDPSNCTEHTSKICGEHGNGHNQNSENYSRKDKQGMVSREDLEGAAPSGRNSGDAIRNTEASSIGEGNHSSPRSNQGQENGRSSLNHLLNGLQFKRIIGNAELADNLVIRRLRAFIFSFSKTVIAWLGSQKPSFVSLKNYLLNVCDYCQMKIKHAYPIVLKWLMHLGSIMLLISMVWLDFTLRGIHSFVRMGTTSFFSVIWCSIFSVIAMAGMLKFLLGLVIAAFVGFFIGFTFAVFIVVIMGIVTLWFHGSFWTTGLIVILGGASYMLSHERAALLITTMYSIYCSWTYHGWLGLLLALNLSFISSDVLIFFLRDNVNRHKRPNGSDEQSSGMHGQAGFFSDEPMRASSSDYGPGISSDHSPGNPSTSGTDSDITSEDEVIRLLNCNDHYSTLGFSRYQDIDMSALKREYRKKAMLVHPDKNMGNERAAEAFKKLQNAYEVLLDSLKRKAYDDELRREELLNIFRRFRKASNQDGRNGFYASGFARSGVDVHPFGESKPIACKKCGDFHLWVLTGKIKSQARWCQECQDFHQAKAGDGWVEQSSQPFLFGLLQKVDSPIAYVCADSKIYNATGWYICQGMRCPANTHKPSFHVNTSVTPKHNNGKGTGSGQRGGWMPASNMEESMTEEEFLELLQNAVKAGMFDNFSGSTPQESASTSSGNGTKNSCSGGGSSSKRKKKGKKQW